MPEGHTIHRIARDHADAFVGQELSVSSPQGRFSREAARLSGRTLLGVEARGKHLCYRWSSRTLLHIHLGLYGKFRMQKAPPGPPRGEVRLRVVGDEKAFDLNGPNRCELISPSQWRAILARLGPDPLGEGTDPTPAFERIEKSRTAIGTLLLNQSVIAGVGNVYRSEVLFLLGIHPETPGRDLSRDWLEALWDELVRLMEIGVRYNRIIVADPKDVGKPRSRMNRSERLQVYKRQRCVACDTSIESWQLGARKIYACPTCQPLAA